MIETAIHLLIGFLLAALLALVVMPTISRRAFRLAETRARMLAPLSATQANADRDALRGQHAIEMLSNERRCETAENAAASAQIELGRRAREIVDGEIEIAEKSAEIAQQRGEIADLGRVLQGRDVEIAAREIALLDLTHQRDAAAGRLADARTRIGEREVSLERSSVEISSLKARNSELTSALIAHEREFQAAALEATARIAGLTDNLVASRAFASRLESQVFELEARYAALRTESDGRAAEAARLRQRVVDLEPRLSESERSRDELAVESGRQTTRASDREAELFRMKTSHREEIERFQDRLSGAAARENELTMRVQALIAARVDAESAMRIATAERDALTKELARFREKLAKSETIASSAANGDAALRRSIARLGRDLADRQSAHGDRAVSEFFASGRPDELAATLLENDEKSTSPLITGA